METEVLFDNRSKETISKETYDKIENAINETLKNENFTKPSQVSVSIVDGEEIKELNKYYRNIDKETDVLSFPMDEEGFEDGELLSKLDRK